MNKKIRITFLLLLSTLFLSLFFIKANNSSQKESNLSLADADNASYQFDLKSMREIMFSILNNEMSSSVLKAETLRKLADQDWKYYRNSHLAIRRLNQADSLIPCNSGTYRLLSKVNRESGDYINALVVSQKSVDYAKTIIEKNSSVAEFAQTIYEISINNLKSASIPDSALLAKASIELQQALDVSPGSPELSKLLFGISLLQKDGDMAINAWLYYFHFGSIEKVNEYLMDCAEELSLLLPNLNKNSLKDIDRERLVVALGKCRLYNFATLIATDFYNPSFILSDQNDEIQDIIRYNKFLEEVTAGTYDYYRKIAVGGHKRLIIPNRDVRKYKRFLRDKRKNLWYSLSFIRDQKYKYREKRFLRETEKHFGAKGFSRSTGLFIGYYLFNSHIVDQEKLIVDQYGYTAEVIKTKVDLNSTLDYASWFLGGHTVGGWAKKKEIIENKEAYLKNPARAWVDITDSTRLQETNKFISENLYHPDMYKQAEALSQKLILDTRIDLYNRLKETGISGFAMKSAFVAEYNRILEEIVFIHEARHAIEKNHMPIRYFFSSGKREFRAKLSQVALSSEPKLGLATLVNDIASGGGHGYGNRKIVEVGIEWVKINSDKILGFSPDKPILPQLSLLTNDQIRECYSSVDPYFSK